jgi:hypothetical protein
MLFSYLLLGLALGLIGLLFGFGQDGFAYGFTFPLVLYFFEVSVRGIASLFKHRRVTYQLIDFGAFLFTIALYVIATLFDRQVGLPAAIVGLALYFGIVFWASKRFPMAPRRDWWDMALALPVLWKRHQRLSRPDSSITG